VTDPPVVDCIIPARDEAPTIAANVAAALGCAAVREVIVVDDGSSDGTAEVAAGAGAKVVRLEGSAGSKAHALRAGADATDADVLLFADADCVGLSARHLDAVVEPVLAGRAMLSIGTFDYGRFWNPQVLRWPPLSGERCVPRWVFDAIPASKLDGYTVEVRINEVACKQRLPVSARTLSGVHHRTKRDKFGRAEGMRRTWQMYKALLGMISPIGDVGLWTYPMYLRLLTVEEPVGQPVSPRRRGGRTARRSGRRSGSTAGWR
jgi:glycosyltransferase involved in cell wall biosynthesis